MNKIPEEKEFNFKKSIGVVILSIVIAMGIISIFINGRFQELFHHIAKANLWLVLLAVSLYFLEVAIWTLRWKFALISMNHDIKFGSLYWICHGGKFVTNVTPIMKAGGDPFRAYFAKKTHKIPYDIGFATLLAESAVSVPVFLSFLTAGLVIWLYITSALWIAIGTGILLGLAIVFFLPLIRWLVERETAMDYIARLINWISEKLGLDQDSVSVTESLKNFYNSTQLVIENRKAAVSMIIATIILYLTTVVRFYIIFLALGLHVSWYIPLLGATVPFLLGLIPFSPGGLVFVEGGMLGLYSLLGIPSITASSAVIIERGISYVVSTVAGGVAASHLGLKIWKSQRYED